MDYTIVTAWYDVREKEKHPLKDDTSCKYFCTMKEYFDAVKPFFNKPFPMVIFTEPRFKEIILAARPIELHDKTRFIFRDYDDLLYYNLFPKYEDNHNNHPIHNLTREKFTALYKFIVNQKVNFVKDAIQFNPFNTEKFAWMDMRLHCVYDMDMDETQNIFNRMSKDKVTIMQMSFTDPVTDRRDFYALTRGKVAAGFFGGRKEPLLKFCELCQKELLTSIEEQTAPTDEMIYSFVISHNRALFDVYVGDYGECLRNILRIRNCLHLVFRFLQSAFHHGIHHYTATLTERIRGGMIAGDISLNADQINQAWYYAYIAHYWLGEHDKCKNILNEYLDIAESRNDVAEHIRGAHPYLIHMTSYLNDANINQRLKSI